MGFPEQTNWQKALAWARKHWLLLIDSLAALLTLASTETHWLHWQIAFVALAWLQGRIIWLSRRLKAFEGPPKIIAFSRDISGESTGCG